MESWQELRAANSLTTLLGEGVAWTHGGQGLLWGSPGFLLPCNHWTEVAERVVAATAWYCWPVIFTFPWSPGEHCWPAHHGDSHGYPKEFWPLCIFVQPIEIGGLWNLSPFDNIFSDYILINHQFLVSQWQTACDKCHQGWQRPACQPCQAHCHSVQRLGPPSLWLWDLPKPSSYNCICHCR